MISVAVGIRPAACLENTVLPSTITSSDPNPPMRSFTFTPGFCSSSRFRLPARCRVSAHQKQRLISMFMLASLFLAVEISSSPSTPVPQRHAQDW